MNDPAFSPVTVTELLVYAVILSAMWIIGDIIIRRVKQSEWEKQQGRANHPTSKGLPRK